MKWVGRFAVILTFIAVLVFIMQQPDTLQALVDSLTHVVDGSPGPVEDRPEQATTVPREEITTLPTRSEQQEAASSSQTAMKEEGLEHSAFYSAETERLEQEFVWDYAGQEWTFSLAIPSALYEHYAAKERLPYIHDGMFAVYATDPLQGELVERMAEGLSAAAAREGWSLRQQVEFTLALIQAMEYVADDMSKGVAQYARYPVETLVEQVGDCKDKSILYASLLSAMGIDVVFIVLAGEPGHLAVGVKGEDFSGTYYDDQGSRYYYAETTSSGWRIGEMPDEYRSQKATIVPVKPQPLLRHHWESQIASTGQVEMVVTVKNLGSDTSYDTWVYVALDAGEDEVYAQQWSEPLDIPPGGEGTYTHYLQAPKGVPMRLLVTIARDRYLVEESSSEWFTI